MSPLEIIFDDDGLKSLQSALAYCREHGLGMIEASDVVMLVANQCISNSHNLRLK